MLNFISPSHSLDTDKTPIDDEQIQEFSSILKQLNEYFDQRMLRHEEPEDVKETNDTNVTKDKLLPEEESIKIERRSNAHTPWYCHSTVGWKDLGNLHYPRFVKEIRCTGNACMHGFYNCSPNYYPLRVLSAREDSSRVNQDVEASFLPPGLRQNWTLMEIDISVGCMCGN
jgi:hypothetical protein